MNTRVEPLRAGLAILTAVAMVFAMILVLGSLPAAAEDVSTWPGTNEANAETFWEKFLNNHDGITGAECTKDETGSETENFVADADYRLVVIKQGSGELANKLYWDVDKGDVLPPAQNDPGWSHVIVCTVPVTTTSSSTTTTVPDTTTTRVRDTTTTTVPDTTTTTVRDTTTTTVVDTTTTTVVDTTTTTVADTTTTTVADTTTTIPDDVLGTVITTSTTAPVVGVTTTIPDEVLDTAVEAEELPFTGIDSELLVGMAVLLLAGGLVLLGVTGKREDA